MRRIEWYGRAARDGAVVIGFLCMLVLRAPLRPRGLSSHRGRPTSRPMLLADTDFQVVELG
jgi:hypothetical protein